MTRSITLEQPFDLAAVLDGTQDFRWHPWQGDSYSGVLDSNLIHLRQVGLRLEYQANTNLDALLRRYFPTRRGYARYFTSTLQHRIETLSRLTADYQHLRLLRQPNRWECMVAYICSANNNVKHISAIVESIAANFGERLELDGDERCSFPTPDMVLDAGVERLKELCLGLDRHSKIVAAAKRICDGDLDLDCLAKPEVSYVEAKRQLKESYGIGDKVADCISLFALDKTEAFPVDRWVKKAMERYFPGPEADGGMGARLLWQACGLC